MLDLITAIYDERKAVQDELQLISEQQDKCVTPDSDAIVWGAKFRTVCAVIGDNDALTMRERFDDELNRILSEVDTLLSSNNNSYERQTDINILAGRAQSLAHILLRTDALSSMQTLLLIHDALDPNAGFLRTQQTPNVEEQYGGNVTSIGNFRTATTIDQPLAFRILQDEIHEQLSIMVQHNNMVVGMVEKKLGQRTPPTIPDGDGPSMFE